VESNRPRTRVHRPTVLRFYADDCHRSIDRQSRADRKVQMASFAGEYSSKSYEIECLSVEISS